MQYIFLIIIIFVNKIALSAEWISEATAKVNILKKIELPGGSIYSSFEVSGAGKDNTGKQSTADCVGHRIDKNNKLEEQKIFVIHFYQMAINILYAIVKKTDTDAGVGKTN